jgi:hypothetical protein
MMGCRLKEVEKENRNHALEQKRKGIQKKQMAVGLGGGLALGGVAAIGYAKKRQEAQNRPMARIRNNFR